MAIPGRGVIAATCYDGFYCKEFGISEIPEFNDPSIGSPREMTADHLQLYMSNSLKAIEVQEGANDYTSNLQVTRPVNFNIRFVDSDNRPVSGVMVRGLSLIPHTEPDGQCFTDGLLGNFNSNTLPVEVAENHITVWTFRVGKSSELYACSAQGRFGRVMQFTPEAGQTEVVMKLVPETIVSGRLVDPNDKPIFGVTLLTSYGNHPNRSPISTPATTMRDGTFKIWLSVGTSYEIVIVGPNGIRYQFFEEQRKY